MNNAGIQRVWINVVVEDEIPNSLGTSAFDSSKQEGATFSSAS